MAKKIEMYEGRPVFQASDSKQLKKAVAKYKGEVPPPYVVRVPDETVSVCSRAFSANKDIGVVILPDSVWSIGDEAFCSCKNLTSIILPESPELTIGYWAFAGCSSLSDISIPSSVRRIKRHAFEYCNNLTKITIPASVWEIGAEAFGSCERLAEVTFLCLVEDVEEIDKDCLFECSNLNKIIVPYKQGIAYKKILPEELHALIVEQSGSATSDIKEDRDEGEEEDMASEIEITTVPLKRTNRSLK